ncbi:MAG: cohesin domain-containing protein [Anaerolineaceae bacterium]
MKNNHRVNRFFSLMALLCLTMGFTVSANGQSNAQVGIFQSYDILPNARVEVPIEIRGVEGLYAVDLEVHFDPTVLTVEDADPATEGVQPALGTFLDAGMTLYNTVDLETGVVRFVMTQVNPSEPKSGDGIILVLYLQGVKEGESTLEVTTYDLSDREGAAIEASPAEAVIKVNKAAQELVATSIPVQNPTNLVQISTMSPTETPTVPATPIPPDPTATPPPAIATKGNNAGAETTMGSDTNLETPNDNGQDSEFSLLENWWILLIILAIIIGLVIYLVKSKSKKNSI